MKTKLYLLFMFILTLNLKAQVTEVQPLNFNYKTSSGVKRTNVPFDASMFKRHIFLPIPFSEQA